MSGNGHGPPKTPDEWCTYLTEYSNWYLDGAGPNRLSMLNEQQISTRWLGCEPASEQAIAATEERLGVALPPSLRGFLLTSNGWATAAEWVDALSACEEISWFRDTHEEFLQPLDDDDEDEEEWEVGIICERSLVIATGEDLFLLDTGAVSADGEYNAYLLEMKYGELLGPCASFSELFAKGREQLQYGSES
ncbi:SMI1/KNR4 family protein [Streptomyces sp. NPDC087659]|uniref:SMI1/KNR4 family protein n=1 Tax=Streptomyces sp. NPDC087659 TaxID=3365801 RepID=UPI0037FEE5F0